MPNSVYATDGAHIQDFFSGKPKCSQIQESLENNRQYSCRLKDKVSCKNHKD